jgi:hypothetical protein
MPGIFISYRREDAAGHAGRLFDRLRSRFGEGSVFMDVSGLEPGVDFVEAIDREVGSCDVLIAVIGREWLGCRGANGRRRLEDPNDFTRIEVARALARGVRVVPVLVEGATMPAADALPSDLQPLARRHAAELRDTRWDADVEDLIGRLASAHRARATISPRLPVPQPRRSLWPWAAVAASAVVLAVAASLAWKAPLSRRGGEVPPTAASTTPAETPVPRTEEPGVPASVVHEVPGPPPVRRMARLVGLPLAEARTILSPAGLDAKVFFEETREAPPDTVLRQLPGPEEPLPDDLRVVELTVAREPPAAPPAPDGPRVVIYYSEESDGPAARELASFLHRSDIPVSRVIHSQRPVSSGGAVLWSSDELRELAERIAPQSGEFLSGLYGRPVPIDVRRDERVAHGTLIVNLPSRAGGGGRRR